VDPLTLLLRWPFLPLRGFLKLAQLLADQAEQELRDPSAVRRQLEESATAADAGLLSDSELSQVEYQAVGRLIAQESPAATGTRVRPGRKEK
jgi:gas vesicle protein GvpG